MIFVERTNPYEPQVVDLLQSSHALMQALFPPEHNNYLSLDELSAKNVHLFGAHYGSVLCGTGALVVKEGYGEIKSMFVHHNYRGRGVADAILRCLEDLAQERCLTEIKLETGDKLYAATKFYKRNSFQLCRPFGEYTTNSSSIFMKKVL
jgi:putative acetyltransferase